MSLDYFSLFHQILTSSQTLPEKQAKLLRIFESVLDNALSDEKISFVSLFAKLSYLGEKFNLDGSLRYELHQVRKMLGNQSDDNKESIFQLLTFLIPKLCSICFGMKIPSEVIPLIPLNSGVIFNKRKISGYLPTIKFYCLEIEVKEGKLVGFSSADPTVKIVVDYKLQDRNIQFSSSIDNISQLPVLMQLIEVEVSMDEIYRPNTIIVEPDFLVDATAIASCFNGMDKSLVGYILRKYLPMSRSKALLLGNMSNYFLDRLIQQPKLTFKEVLPELFENDPMGFTVLKDTEVKQFVSDLQNHFKNIQYTVNNTLLKEGIDPSKVYLEPSFISPIYGLQGRLDLLLPDAKQPKIVELKSGGIYKPNAYGVNSPHYIQTLMYDLLIRSTFKRVEPKNYILYSKEQKNPLRLAPRIVAQQKDALQVRNELLHLETEMALVDKKPGFFDSINTNQYPDKKGFEKSNIEEFEKVWSGLDQLERAYFKTYSAFIAKEHKLSKIGEYGQDKRNGLAGLWLDSVEEKTEQFAMLTMLEIEENKADELQPIIRLVHSDQTNEICNFRQGDILVLYPLGKGTASPQNNQIFKCNAIDIQGDEITVRLRGIQKNFQIFNENKFWALEHDTIDTSFTNMYRQLFLWAAAPKLKRELVIGRRLPTERKLLPFKLLANEQFSQLTDNQKEVLSAMIQSPDYYLVWGPPGTGKTSMLICKYIQYMMDFTKDNLYVLAYTNRAVDELCACIHSLGEKYVDMYVRVGSAYGADEKYVPNLMRSKIKGITHRNKLKEKIQSHRIVVGTIASLASRQVIYDLIPAKRVVIDEASQILEPNIIGLLTRFEHYILVGDHKQLPAVVVQPEDASLVEEESLQGIGLKDRRNSLFERIYHLARKENKNYLYGQLKMQARMHEEIMKFPNEEFYQYELIAMPKIERLRSTPSHSIPRVGFIQADVPEVETFSKTNHKEIERILEFVPRVLKEGYKPKDIGIITLYRAQIAAIQSEINSTLKDCEDISVDTVERYQGSAKNVIIISFCCNSSLQFEQMQSLDDEGVDRKLNVAITRAREHLILIGDENILSGNKLYKRLLLSCEKIEM